jgi:hypothetical protein
MEMAEEEKSARGTVSTTTVPIVLPYRVLERISNMSRASALMDAITWVSLWHMLV